MAFAPILAAIGGVASAGKTIGDIASSSGGSSDVPMPEYNYTQLDPGTKALLERNQTRAMQSPEQLTEQALSGTEAAGQPVLPSAEKDQLRAASLGGSTQPDLSEAINRRALKSFGSDLNRMGQLQALNSPLQANQNLMGHQALLGKNAKLQNSMQNRSGAVAQNVGMADFQNQQDRNNVIQGALGGAGKAIGAGVGALANAPKKDTQTDMNKPGYGWG